MNYLISLLSLLKSSGNVHQQYARQHNMNLANQNNEWYLYCNGKLLATFETALQASEYIARAQKNDH